MDVWRPIKRYINNNSIKKYLYEYNSLIMVYRK